MVARDGGGGLADLVLLLVMSWCVGVGGWVGGWLCVCWGGGGISGVFVEDFIKIQTKGGPVATAAELSGRIQIGDVITHVGQTDVQFSSASLVRDLLEKVGRDRPTTTPAACLPGATIRPMAADWLAASCCWSCGHQSARPVTLSFERFPQRYSFKVRTPYAIHDPHHHLGTDLPLSLPL